MSEQAEKHTVTIQPALAVRPLSAADVGRAALVNGGVSFITQDGAGLALATYTVDKFVIRKYDGSAVAVLMGRLVFGPDIKQAVNVIAPHFYALELFVEGGDPYLVVQTPTRGNAHAFCMLNCKAGVTTEGSAKPMHAFRHWSLSVRNADNTLSTLISFGADELAGVKARSYLTGA
jgi:hypothetical protein